MKPLILTIALLLFSFHFAFSQDTTFTANDFDSATVYYKTKYIPDFIKKELTFRNVKFTMADTGKEFDAGCTGDGPKERLICFIALKNRCVLYSEHGGVGYGTECKLYEVNGENVKAVWYIERDVDSVISYKMLKETLKEHKYYVWRKK